MPDRVLSLSKPSEHLRDALRYLESLGFLLEARDRNCLADPTAIAREIDRARRSIGYALHLIAGP